MLMRLGLWRFLTVIAAILFTLVLGPARSDTYSSAHIPANLISDLSGPQARAASLALGTYGDQAVSLLLRHVGAADWSTRYWIAAALGQTGGPRALKALSGLLRDSDTRVCVSALLACREASAPPEIFKILNPGTSSNPRSVTLLQAFKLVTGTHSDCHLLKAMLISVEHSTLRMQIVPSDNEELICHDAMRVGDAYLHLYGDQLDAGTSMRCVWTRKREVHEQTIRFPKGWYVSRFGRTETQRVATWQVDKGGMLVVILNSAQSGNVNLYSAACYKLKQAGWHLENPDPDQYTFDDFGDCFFAGNHLYIYNGDGGNNTKMDPQTFILWDYIWLFGRFKLASKRETVKLYTPNSSSNPLAEFGMKKQSWRDNRPHWD